MLGGVGSSGFAERVVGLFGPIAAENLDDAVGAVELAEHGVKDIEGAGVVGSDFVVVAVAEEVAEGVERLGNVGIADAVDDVDDIAAAARQLELVLLAIDGNFVVVAGDESDAGQVNVCQQGRHGVNAVLVVLNGARAGSGSEGDEEEEGSGRRDPTGRSEAANESGKKERQNSKTPGVILQQLYTAGLCLPQPECRRCGNRDIQQRAVVCCGCAALSGNSNAPNRFLIQKETQKATMPVVGGTRGLIGFEG